MEAGKLWMLREFIGTNKVLFRIPVYQRNYDWSAPNCNRLLDDIKTIMDTGEKHFLGTIVFMAANGGGFSLQEYTIIDGQQRLTTIMLMLKALADASMQKEQYVSEEITETFLHNKYCTEEFKVKLKPIKSDNDQFVALLNNRFEDLDAEGHIAINYNLMKSRIEGWMDRGYTASAILSAMEKLEIVEIVLTKGEDDPQIIFESINSTGLELSNADLIRNFLLMNAADQESLFENYWLYIEKTLKKGTDYSNLNAFFMQYLIFKTSGKVEGDKIYQRFVKLFKDRGYTQESSLSELKYYADIFHAFVFDDSKYSKGIRRSLRSLRQLKQTTCYPFLLHVFDDYEQGVITEEVLEKTVRFILIYVLRRLVCGIQSNTLRNFFRTLYDRVFKVAGNKEHYYEAVNYFVYTETTNKDVMPSDSEFSKALREGNMYSNSALCKYLLMDIENGDSKEILDFEKLTIEHIMPQMQSMAWMHILEKDHETYLHVLGNLTITGYNSELSNKGFDEKKRIIKDNSKAVILNSDVITKDVWDTQSIKKRGERLSQIVKARYDVKQVEDKFNYEYLSVITLDDYNDVTGKSLAMFSFDGETYKQTRFILMLSDVIRLLDQRNPGHLEKLAHAGFSFSEKYQHIHLSSSPEGMRGPWEIKEGVFVEANIAAKSIMKFIDALFVEYGVDRSLFSISIISEEDADESEDIEDQAE